jgi:predicted acyl esterase
VGRVSKPGAYSGYSEQLYEGFELTSRYVAVRDGTRLAMDLFRPKDLQGAVVATPLPVVWMHTPYNRRYFRGGLTASRYPGAALKLSRYGYVVAVVDFRGLYASYGANVAYNRGEWIDAARWDAYDITEWLAVQPFCTGAVGMWGCSATGGSQLQAATTAPPHLKAIFPMSCEFDAFSFGAAGGIATPRGLPTSRPEADVTPAQRDALAVPVDADADKAMLAVAIAQHAEGIDSPGYVPHRDSVSDQFPERWWIKSSPHTYLEAINASGIAIYVAANWDEGRTKYGVFFTFNNLENGAKLVIGPGSHCDWQTAKDLTGFEIVVEELRFFDHWLKGVDNGVMEEPPVCYYTYGAPAGQEWRTAPSWPLPNQRLVRYYLGRQSLGTNAPGEGEGSDTIAVDYDVKDESPSARGLAYVTEPLSTDVELTGHPVVDLWVASTATDGDFVASLENLAPDGTAVSYHVTGQLRASQRALHDPPYDNLGLPWHRSHERDAIPLVPGEPAQLVFDLMPLSMVFKAGHRIRLILTFTAGRATPRLDPAPRVTVYRDPVHPSSITLPFV